ncbi:MAG TPA: type VII secretion integral membrane protein EccD [Pseudonocardiaceae bacterium]|nr:type VII secretion integral membrane protein EccD [Pseudonocardiaceae bacterium]
MTTSHQAPSAGVAPTCRVTVVTPYARVDVALPVRATLAELVPQLIRLAGAEGQASPDNPGWVLSRLGGAAFPPGLTVTAAAIRDGDVLYLNPRERQVAPLVFDDVIDAIASAAESRAGAWGPKVAYRIAIVAAAVLAAGATVLLSHSLSGTPLAPVACGVLGIVLLLAAGALGRAYSDVDAGVAAAAAGVPAALLAGMSAVPPHQFGFGAGQLALGLAAVTLYGVLVVVLVPHRVAWFIGLTLAATFGAIGAAVVVLTGARAAGVAAVVPVLATALGAAGPMISLRLARLPLPTVPADMDSFRAEEKPTMDESVLGQTSTAETMLTGLLGALGLVVIGSMVVLTRTGSGSQAVWQVVLGALLALVWLLRSRSYAGAAQRIVLVGTGLASLALLGGWLAAHGDQLTQFAACAVLVAGAVISVIYANRVRRGRRSPSWSRWLDVVEFISLLALIPLAGLVLNLYAAIRGAI